MKLQRRLAAMLLAGVAISVTVGVTSAPAHASSFARMNIWNSDHCLDNDTGNDAKVQMWRCTGGSEQQWLPAFNGQASAYTLINQNTGWCITAQFIGEGPVRMDLCNAALIIQQWAPLVVTSESPGGSYIVWQSKANNLCLTTPSVGNGTIPRTTVCDPSDQYDRWHQE